MQQPLQTIFSPFTPTCLHRAQIEKSTFILQNPFRTNNPLLNSQTQSVANTQLQVQQINQSSVQQIGNCNVVLALSDQFLVLMEEKQNMGYLPSYYTTLDFDLKFEVLRKQWPDQTTPGQAVGFRFQRHNGANRLQFYSSSIQTLDIWRRNLEHKINQRNFHQLFKAKKKIGKGAFATVYLAQRLLDKKMVAVKAFSKQKQFSTKNGKEALINEIKLMRSVDHPNIIKLEGIYETQNSIYMTLEILEGGQLHQRLKSQKRFSTENNQKIIFELLKALNHLAKKRIIHRDLKTENIMFKKKNSFEIVLCDFGLATFADQSQYLFVRCGTPGFVSPQIINIKDMTTKSEPISDVFSAGIIFHYLLLGHSIFPGKKYNEVLVQNRTCDFNFYQQEYQKLDPRALDLMKKMLEVNPIKRPSAQQCLSHPYFGGIMDVEQSNQNFPIDMIDQQAQIIQLSQKKSSSSQNSYHIPKSTTLSKKISNNLDEPPMLSNCKKQDSFFVGKKTTQNQSFNGKFQLMYKKSEQNKENLGPHTMNGSLVGKPPNMFNSFNRSLQHKNSEQYQRT